MFEFDEITPLVLLLYFLIKQYKAFLFI